MILVSLWEIKMILRLLLESFFSVVNSVLDFCGVRIVVGLLSINMWVFW